MDPGSDVGHFSLLPAGTRRKSRGGCLVSADTYLPVIDGCLQRWGFYYKVIGSNGTIYNLTRSTRGLSHYIGDEVKITGKPTVISLDTTAVHAASKVEELPAHAVKSVKELSKACSVGQQ